jgi:hypothetical protein
MVGPKNCDTTKGQKVRCQREAPLMFCEGQKVRYQREAPFMFCGSQAPLMFCEGQKGGIVFKVKSHFELTAKRTCIGRVRKRHVRTHAHSVLSSIFLAFLAGNINRPTKNFMKKKRKTGTMKYGVRYSAGWSAGALAWTHTHTHTHTYTHENPKSTSGKRRSSRSNVNRRISNVLLSHLSQ